MKLKIACIVDLEVPENASVDELYTIACDVISENRPTSFVIEEVDGDQNHPLVDEAVP